MYDDSFEQAIPIQEVALIRLWNTPLFPVAVMFDHNRVITAVNRQFKEQTGLLEKEMVGLAFSEVFHLVESGPNVVMEMPGRHVQIRTASGEVMEFDFHMIMLETDSTECKHLALLSNGTVKTRTLLQQFAMTFLKDENLGVILMQPDFRVSDMSRWPAGYLA